ncbi:Hypothetical Protein FCC1311_077632 [Hondaea fermentalgiana]|uniref:Uncharacterized protein n=1 Tax=Hondaea fermentalgiana TaxID=2315210 RepID=A0A2R5GMK8_9STRA|nr:Hypothetical Protein FCC1311_077632 [Hondaea fermentalgiana]|eukprot:GBG31539.1 Hypothetical Protein FCC1311_077632 [Hondaea fermentalgiana]
MFLAAVLVVTALCTRSGQACMPSNSDGSVTLGETTFVCLVRDNAAYALSKPRADRYSRLTYDQTYEENRDDCQEQLFHIESMGVQSSFRKRYCTEADDGTLLFFPILTAIINVDENGVTDISWDDGCYFTDGSVSESVQTCVANAYGFNTSSPIDSVPAPSQGSDTALTREVCDSEPDGFCDLAVYVAWTGKDSNGNYFGSSGRRFSVFRDYDLQIQYDAMRLFLLNEK